MVFRAEKIITQHLTDTQAISHRLIPMKYLNLLSIILMIGMFSAHCTSKKNAAFSLKSPSSGNVIPMEEEDTTELDFSGLDYRKLDSIAEALVNHDSTYWYFYNNLVQAVKTNNSVYRKVDKATRRVRWKNFKDLIDEEDRYMDSTGLDTVPMEVQEKIYQKYPDMLPPKKWAVLEKKRAFYNNLLHKSHPILTQLSFSEKTYVMMRAKEITRYDETYKALYDEIEREGRFFADSL